MNLELRQRAQKIKVVAFDVDGVMTDGSLTFLEDGREIKTFNAKDGQGIVSLNKAGIKTAIAAARNKDNFFTLFIFVKSSLVFVQNHCNISFRLSQLFCARTSVLFSFRKGGLFYVQA